MRLLMATLVCVLMLSAPTILVFAGVMLGMVECGTMSNEVRGRIIVMILYGCVVATVSGVALMDSVDRCVWKREGGQQ